MQGQLGVEVEDIVCHSKSAKKGSLFVCVEGMDFDGHLFAKEAVGKGSAVVVCSKPLSFQEEITVLKVPDCRKAMAVISSAFYDYPGKKLRLIGVTGTKGKTTVCYMLRDILSRAGMPCGMISTVEIDTGRERHPSRQTTPESLELQKYLWEMVQNGCQAAVIEVSSQALKLSRVYGLTFEVGILTGFSPDHISPKEHLDVEEYRYWKSRLFSQCNMAVVNRDIPCLGQMVQDADCPVFTYGLGDDADLWAKTCDFVRIPGKLGVEFQTKGRYNVNLVIGLPGRFSVYNALAALQATKAIGVEDEHIQKTLTDVNIPGRQELFFLDYDKLIVVDYAHNGAALEALLSGLRCYGPKKLTCIFGCGGQRDPDRRKAMGGAAAKYADFSIITADNPRKEPLDDIICDIIKGMENSGHRYKVMKNRQEAIFYGVSHCVPGEIVVVAGKGHEDMQILEHGAIQFDDRQVVRASIEKVKYEQNYNRRD